MVGPHVTDLIEAGVVAIDAEATVETVADGMAAAPDALRGDQGSGSRGARTGDPPAEPEAAGRAKRGPAWSPSRGRPRKRDGDQAKCLLPTRTVSLADASASGPASAWPTGMKISETIQSNEFTRNNRSARDLALLEGLPDRVRRRRFRARTIHALPQSDHTGPGAVGLARRAAAPQDQATSARGTGPSVSNAGQDTAEEPPIAPPVRMTPHAAAPSELVGARSSGPSTP